MGKASRRKKELRTGEAGDAISQEQSTREARVAESLLRGDQPEGIAPGSEICDFCSSPDVKWGYRTKAGDPTEGGKAGGWAACDDCHALIEAGKHDALARRSVEGYIIKYPEMSQLPMKHLLVNFKIFHDGFREHRVGPAMTSAEYIEKYGRKPFSNVAEFMKEEGLALLAGAEPTPGDQIARPIPAGSPLYHHTQEGYVNEGITAEQLTDPRTVDYIMDRISRDRPTPNIPLTIPVQPVIRQWVGARTYIQACAGVYGDTPRSDDMFDPKPAMMLAQTVLEPILGAHPVVLEPEQMNAIDDEDWSFAEANDYAQMAHLPFEPIYIDFGGHEPVMVDLEAGPCQLHGAVIWRSGFFKTPTLAVAPIGGFAYLTGPLADMLIAEGIDEDKVVKYVGSRPGKEIHEGDVSMWGSRNQRVAMGSPLYRIQDFRQWHFQTSGICWFGVKTDALGIQPYATMSQKILQERGETEVPLVFSTEEAIAQATGTPRERVQANILTGMWDNPDADMVPGWARMMKLATEMVAKLSERALLGMYFIENAPVQINQVALSRPERREMERKTKKGKDPGKIASIVVIRSSRSTGERSETTTERHYTYRWERRGHFQHIHSNNRQYQNRPDLIKPCHKCSVQYAENVAAKQESREEPWPNVESPDCIKRWIEPTVCGPEGLPLKKKVRVRRANQEAA